MTSAGLRRVVRLQPYHWPAQQESLRIPALRRFLGDHRLVLGLMGGCAALCFAVVVMAVVGALYIRGAERDLARIAAMPGALKAEVQAMRGSLLQERERRRAQLPDCVKRLGGSKAAEKRCRTWIGI